MVDLGFDVGIDVDLYFDCIVSLLYQLKHGNHLTLPRQLENTQKLRFVHEKNEFIDTI